MSVLLIFLSLHETHTILQQNFILCFDSKSSLINLLVQNVHGHSIRFIIPDESQNEFVLCLIKTYIGILNGVANPTICFYIVATYNVFSQLEIWNIPSSGLLCPSGKSCNFSSFELNILVRLFFPHRYFILLLLL